MSIRIGLVGYGVGGRLFHAPYIQASEYCNLVGVVARSPHNKAAVAQDLPDVAIVDSLAELIALGVDAVVISTPPETRRALALEVISSGVAVVADKPFAPSAAAAEEIATTAEKAGVLLNVFHNRRQDTDIVTALKVQDRLGQLIGLDLRLDIDEADTLELGPQGGLLRDLGSHVVDQSILLMGPARTVTAHLGYIDHESDPTIARFRIFIEHESGAVSNVSASKIDRLNSRELRIYGTAGTYTSAFNDVQIQHIKRGITPSMDRSTWGYEEKDRWGVLTTAAGQEVIPSEQGDYTRFYDDFAKAVKCGGSGPVPAQEGIEVLKVLDAVLESAAQGRTINIQ
ncbi:Gfo/Idh/MocA family oxidoreductase [Corynebacterium callunae]|uniref:Gfo/Idh/MocA family oxidoreductase n=1 Tax=Corynebacterium callunae TaxID=1721 RepID=UPI0020005170|nr:Gfo/Idh/MocA family oxidoreductase [Corynebacterium callunae]